jgi:hypothetical protein
MIALALHRRLAALPRGVVPCVIAWVGLTASPSVQAGPGDSPFLPPSGSTAAVASPSENLEFAGWNSVGEKTFVNIFDKSTKKGRWISVGGSDGTMSVLAYDPRREQVVVKSGDTQKTLTLRKSSGVASAPAPVAVMPPSAGFAQPAIAPINQNIAPAVAMGPVATAEPAPAPAPPEPAKPQTVQRQEEEARMLVSDLLEIGMAQHRAYEEAQKKASEQPAVPAAPAPTPSGP